jgi:hypothetical protein
MSSDRDRLIELLANFRKPENPMLQMAERRIIERMADYLLANGVIVPPAEVGQTVWYVDDFTEEIEECKVYGFNVVNGKLSLLVDNGEDKFITRKWHKTKEEAEEKLKELGK